jgi:hypothetical protein
MIRIGRLYRPVLAVAKGGYAKTPPYSCPPGSYTPAQPRFTQPLPAGDLPESGNLAVVSVEDPFSSDAAYLDRTGVLDPGAKLESTRNGELSPEEDAAARRFVLGQGTLAVLL